MRTKTTRASAFQTFSATSNANTVVAGGSLSLTATAGDTAALALPKLPSILRNQIRRITTIKSRTEIVQIGTITYTAANSTRYAFFVDQLVNGVVNTQLVDYTSDATGTDAEIAAAILANINSATSQGSLQITATGSSSPVTLTALTGSPLFTIRPITGVTYASAQTNINAALQAGAITNAAPRAVTAVAHGLNTGDTVIFAGVTGTGAANVNGTKRITKTGVDTFTIDGTTATGTVVVTAATCVEVAQASFGTPTQVEESLAAQGLDFTALATVWYDCIEIDVAQDDDNDLNVKLWCASHLIATANTPTTNYAQFTTDMSAFKTSTAAEAVTAVAMFGIPG